MFEKFLNLSDMVKKTTTDGIDFIKPYQNERNVDQI